MSNKPYTPETIDIKMAYVTSFDPEGVHKILAHMVAEMTTGHAADFDRWLAEHDRQVAAAAVKPLLAVHDQYFNTEVSAWDAAKDFATEDTWRFDRDFRAAAGLED